MAVYPRRFRAVPVDNLMGPARPGAQCEGVLFTDGSVCVRWLVGWPTCVVFPDRGIEALESGVGFGGPMEVEWLDGAHG